MGIEMLDMLDAPEAIEDEGIDLDGDFDTWMEQMLSGPEQY